MKFLRVDWKNKYVFWLNFLKNDLGPMEYMPGLIRSATGLYCYEAIGWTDFIKAVYLIKKGW